MGVFRWLRDHYVWIRATGGLMLIALGVLLFVGQILVAPRAS